jgi:hypothetical protein
MKRYRSVKLDTDTPEGFVVVDEEFEVEEIPAAPVSEEVEI